MFALHEEDLGAEVRSSEEAARLEVLQGPAVADRKESEAGLAAHTGSGLLGQHMGWVQPDEEAGHSAQEMGRSLEPVRSGSKGQLRMWKAEARKARRHAE